MARNVGPAWVGKSASATRRTRLSERRRIWMTSVTVTRGSFCTVASASSSAVVTRLPSRPSTAHSAADGPRPASRDRSLPASGSAARTRTPPGAPSMVVTWPGITRAAGVASSATAARTVVARPDAPDGDVAEPDRVHDAPEAERADRRHPVAAEEDRRDEEHEPIDHVGGERLGRDRGAAFDEHARQSASTERAHDRRERDRAATRALE